MNFSACWIVSSDIETGVFGVATDVPGLGIECHEFQCLLDCFVRYRNRCLWCCDRCSSACWIVSSDIETSVFGVATDVPGLSIVMLTYKKSSLLLELFLVKS
ncbi:uncharacterized protein [Dysidea avara]|uniref:uncharacterized protein isoform X1 n=1 Tax=Dysidea avara TaxID=196820 RepID=UPI00331D1F3B